MNQARGYVSLLTGSFSTPAAGNPTVVIVEAAYRHRGLDARYINCEVSPESLGDAVRGARAMGWVGFNCSIPHKVAVISHLDRLGDSARIIGAVNCAVRRGDQLIGENTDGQGFLTSLRTVVDPAGKALVLFGAGGAARAIAVETALAGATSITVVNRDPVRGGERSFSAVPLSGSARACDSRREGGEAMGAGCRSRFACPLPWRWPVSSPG